MPNKKKMSYRNLRWDSLDKKSIQEFEKALKSIEELDEEDEDSEAALRYWKLVNKFMQYVTTENGLEHVFMMECQKKNNEKNKTRNFEYDIMNPQLLAHMTNETYFSLLERMSLTEEEKEEILQDLLESISETYFSYTRSDLLPKKKKPEGTKDLAAELENKATTLVSILPKLSIIVNSKISSELTKDFIGKGEIPIKVNKRNAKKEVLVYASLTYEGENIELSGRQEFTPYDRVVHNSVVTLHAAGNEIFTPEMVYRAMNGLTESEKVSPQAIGAVTRSIEKSRVTKLTIDYTQEAKARNLDVKEAKYDGMLLNADKVTGSVSGVKKEAYRLLRTPILYEYSQQIKQIISVPIQLLQTKEALRSTDEVIVIRFYLIQRIEIMKNNKNQSNKILYSTIFEELGKQNPTKQKAEKIRDATKAILGLLIKKEYIQGYQEYKEGRQIKGIEILLEERPPRINGDHTPE